MWRHQLPSWSPVTGGMIWAGLLGSRRTALDRWGAMLAAEYGASRVLLTASGTAALTLALSGSRRRPRVALPAWGCPDLATAADGADAAVFLYDLDPSSLCPDLDDLTRVVREGVDAIVVAHFYGIPVDTDSLRMIAATAGGVLIDDAAQGMGGRWRDKPLGSAGDVGVLSFGRGKGRTGGGGGALFATSDRGLTVIDHIATSVAPACGRMGRELAGLLGLWLLARPSLFRIPASLPFLRLGESPYHPPSTPRRMNPLMAAVLVAGQLPAEREAQVRRESGAWWLNHLRHDPELRVIEPAPEADPGWLRFPVIVPPDRVAEFAAPVMRALGVMPGYPVPIGQLTGFDRRLAWRDPRGWPGADLLARRLFTLPTHSRVSPGDRDRLCRLLRRSR